LGLVLLACLPGGQPVFEWNRSARTINGVQRRLAGDARRQLGQRVRHHAVRLSLLLPSRRCYRQHWLAVCPEFLSFATQNYFDRQRPGIVAARRQTAPQTETNKENGTPCRDPSTKSFQREEPEGNGDGAAKPITGRMFRLCDPSRVNFLSSLLKQQSSRLESHDTK